MSKQKALLHIGAGEMQQHSILAAKSLGLYVVVTDQSPTAPSISLADHFIQCSGSDHAALLTIAQELNQRFQLVSAYSSSDFGVTAVALIHQTLGLPGCSIKATELALNKFESKKIWQQKNVSTPPAIILTSAQTPNPTDIQYPAIVKPIDSCGSQGISSVTSAADIIAACDNAFRYSDEILIESYIEGLHYDSIGLMWRGQFIPMGLGNRLFSDAPYHFPLWGYVPSDLNAEQSAAAYKITEDAAKALKLDYTPVKADLIFANGQFHVIEIAPRFHGDVFTSKLIPLSGMNSPIEHLFRCRLQPDLRPNFSLTMQQSVIWKALFPIELTQYQQQLESVTVSDIFLNKKKAITQHQDNTSLIGFIWDIVPDGQSFTAHYQHLNKTLTAFL